jgi:cold shock CspA family protein
MQGRISRIVKPVRDPQGGHFVRGGFGFLIDEDGQSRFFHAHDVEGLIVSKENEFLVPLTPLQRVTLAPGQHVEFEPYEEPKSTDRNGRTTGGLRAAHVRVTP